MKGKEMRRFYAMFTWSIALLLFLGCATTLPPGSDSIRQKSLSASAPGQPDQSVQAFLYGGNGIDSGMSIACTEEGACLLFGDTVRSFGWSMDYLAVKISADQKVIWAKTYDGSGADGALFAVAASDGGFLLVGLSKSMLFTPLKSTDKQQYPLIIKTDSTGDIQWATVIDYYMSGFDFHLNNAVQTADKGYIFSGSSPRCKDKNKGGPLLFKLSEKGDLLWANCYHLSTGSVMDQFRVTETQDRNLAVLFSATEKFGLFLTDFEGKPIWAKTLKSPDTKRIWPQSLVIDNKGRIIATVANVVSITGSGQANAGVSRFTSQGNILWSRQYNMNKITYPRVIVSAYDQQFLIAGVTGDGVWGYLIGYKKPVNYFAFLIDEDGNEKSCISPEKPTVGVRSAVKSQGRYFLFSDYDLSKETTNFYLLLWNPLKDARPDSLKQKVSQSPFQLSEENAAITPKPVELHAMKIEKKILQVRDLGINRSP
ncbi:MAG: hypothetical protein HPY65_15670 [Syntrophaceae bacterium]|nr:hypothetical protein [Syntrophaceae bacterium]